MKIICCTLHLPAVKFTFIFIIKLLHWQQIPQVLQRASKVYVKQLRASQWTILPIQHYCLGALSTQKNVHKAQVHYMDCFSVLYIKHVEPNRSSPSGYLCWLFNVVCIEIIITAIFLKCATQAHSLDNGSLYNAQEIQFGIIASVVSFNALAHSRIVSAILSFFFARLVL